MLYPALFSIFVSLGATLAYLGGFREARQDVFLSIRYLVAGEICLLISLAAGWSFIGLPIFNWLDTTVPALDRGPIHSLVVAALMFLSSAIFIVGVAYQSSKIGTLRGKPRD